MPCPVRPRCRPRRIPDAEIPLRRVPWAHGLSTAVYLALTLGAAWLVVVERQWGLRVLGVPLSATLSRALMAPLAFGLALLALDAALKVWSLHRLRTPRIALRSDGLALPAMRFLRGVVPVHVPWRDIQDVALRQTGPRAVVDIETVAGRRHTLSGALTTTEWPAARIAEAIQQEAARR